MDVLVIVPVGMADPSLPAGAMLVTYSNVVDAVVALKGGDAPAVLVSDGIGEDGAEAVAAAIRDRGAPCIEVRSERWDGSTISPVSAACRGVVSGFGVGGVAAAVRAVSDEA